MKLNVLNTILNSNDLYTPIKLTKQINSAILLAELMINDLPKGNFKDFIITNLNRPVDLLGDIDIYDNLQSKYWIQTTENSKYLNPKNLELSSGVYMFEHLKLGTKYIGSAVNFGDRLRVHQKEINNPKTYFHKYVFEHGGFSNFKWGPIYQTTNYLKLFRTINPYYKLSKGEVVILTHLTQLEARVLEQSLLFKYKPSLNSDINVYFPIQSWDPIILTSEWKGTHLANKIEIWYNPIINTTKDSNGVPDNFKNTNNPLIVFNSTLEASRQLGISRHKLMRYLNHNTPAYSPLLDISVIIKHPEAILKTESVKSHRLKDRPIQNVNLEQLEVGRLYAYLPDKKTVYSEYSSTGEAASNLNPKKFLNKTPDNRFILRYINQEKLVKTELGTFYFMSHPNTLKQWSDKVLAQPIYVIDIKEGTATL